MDSHQAAWAAGLFEGEGCWNVYQRPKRGKEFGVKSSIQARLGMTDLDVVEHFGEVMGVGNIYGPTTKGRNKPMYTWAAYGFEDIQYVVAAFWPYLGQRRRARAVEVLEAGRYVQRKGDRPNCPNGHPYSGANLLLEPRQGGAFFARRCKICRAAQAAEKYQRRKARSAA